LEVRGVQDKEVVDAPLEKSAVVKVSSMFGIYEQKRGFDNDDAENKITILNKYCTK
tara:strand:+ start:796 stop:963 length:168 start_codon:yes stop_codon:yes gene_type:complete